MDEYGLDLVGADDDDVLAMLGEVSGEDLVGDDDDDDDDDVSGDDLVGDEDEFIELVGAARRGRLSKRGMKRLGGLLARRAKKGQLVTKGKRRAMFDRKQRELSRAGRIPQIQMGIASVGNVLAGAPAVLIVTPSVPVRVTDFFVDAAAAPLFILLNLTVGRINLFATGDAVPCSIYDPTAGLQRAPLEIRKVPAGSPISMTVQNISLADAPFRGVFQVIDLGTRVY